MSDPRDPRDAADREAADWHVRLGERPLPAATLLEFRDWRAVPGNAAAWQRIEALWRAAGTLSGDPDIREMTRDVLRQPVPRPKTGRPGLWPAVAVAGAAVVLAVVLGLWLPSRDLLTTGIGEQRLVRLEDGSRVRLDTDTRLRVRYDAGQRRLDLEQGQALFMVAREPGRPFRVRAGGTEVTALGTTFDVRREDEGARVTLVTGAVAVSAGQGEAVRRWQLTPGQQLRTDSREPRPQAVDADVETSWSEGRLIFRDTPLGEAVAEVNRYLPDRIVLEGTQTRSIPVSGVFTAGDGEAFVAATTDLFGLRAEPEPGGGVRLTAPSAGG